jgi:dTDP-4-dehydrorhamnose reductase
LRILIAGGDGMLGHALLRALDSAHEVRVTLRRELQAYAGYGLFHSGNAYAGIEMRDTERLGAALEHFRPQAVINAVGVVKQRPEAADAIPSIAINALFPHQLAGLCARHGARLVHMSTDCVFSGDRGGYREEDLPDATDLYGRSKLLGELHDQHCLTLRTSIIGRELSRKTGLLEWFLAQSGPVRGYREAIFSGFTTAEMARIIERVLSRHPRMSGLYHVSSEPIAKYDLLTLIKRAFRLTTEIVPDDNVRIDRSLDSTRFRSETGYMPPAWPRMIDELARDTAAAAT